MIALRMQSPPKTLWLLTQLAVCLLHLFRQPHYNLTNIGTELPNQYSPGIPVQGPEIVANAHATPRADRVLPRSHNHSPFQSRSDSERSLNDPLIGSHPTEVCASICFITPLIIEFFIISRMSPTTPKSVHRFPPRRLWTQDINIHHQRNRNWNNYEPSSLNCTTK